MTTHYEESPTTRCARFEYRCQICMSRNVQCQNWIDPNAWEILDSCDSYDWCDDCNNETSIESFELHYPMPFVVGA